MQDPLATVQAEVAARCKTPIYGDDFADNIDFNNDTLVDAIGPLADTGVVWLMTPKRGQAGHVEPSDVAEAAPTAGLAQTSTLSVGSWTGTRLATPKASAGKAKSQRR